ncbi:hypothetical protein ACKI1I_17975 [Streptomyces turgidiscabies]|uniref:Uncharacterized protein n=1 Tax=Streptomyces turgidiscabies (strain Car8) TaxID=698760 RepID=L7FFL1_STRT8|nr:MULTISPECIES: hypothetical protein [Streptomyces]ELP69989.1 hypothetical protein STRTUCAR8_07102 [Streptomyces turgidiscabies Car8]MDX3497993.1 hypothetical protein [Streptomyces turgidiscabies]GAQ69902.1 hypothetical protein T45_01633 [Streptomyces turgidiscabies]
MSVEHRDDQFEDRLGAALRNAGGAFDADRAALVAGGETRGRRLRTRRRTAVVSGAAAIALVGVGGALITPWGGDGSGQRSAGATGTTVGPGDATGTPSGASTGTADSPTLSGDQLLSTLKELLPEGKLSEESARGTDSKHGPSVYAVFDDGKGAGALSLGFGRVAPGSAQARQATECPDTAFVPYDDCARSTLPGGSALMILKRYEYADRHIDTKLWTATLVTPDGGQVTMSEWNAAAEKGAPVSRPEPPLSSAQLKTLVTDPAWLKVVDTLPEASPSQESPATPPGAGTATLLTTLTGLLPKGQGLRVVRKSDEGTEYGYVVVDDGKGESFVQVNVQPNMQDVEDQLFGEGSGAVTLPDGIKVVVRQGPGDDKGRGLVMRTADAYWPDGLRVVVSAFNSASQVTGPTRENPALTLDQLKAIATDSKWQQLQPVPN